jgi:hypothetical protein
VARILEAREDLWHAEANRNTRVNKNGKPSILKKVMKSVELGEKKQPDALGPQLTNRAKAAKRAEAAAGKRKVKPAHAKAGEKAAERRSTELSRRFEPHEKQRAIIF